MDMDDEIQYLWTTNGNRATAVKFIPVNSDGAIVTAEPKDGKVSIGRRPPNELQPTAQTAKEFGKALFRCPVVSRRHAELEFCRNGEVLISDLSSHHGTHIVPASDTGSCITIQPNVKRALESGDVITFGKVVRQGGEEVQPVKVRVVIVPSRSTSNPPDSTPNKGRYRLPSIDSESDMDVSSDSEAVADEPCLFPSISDFEDEEWKYFCPSPVFSSSPFVPLFSTHLPSGNLVEDAGPSNIAKSQTIPAPSPLNFFEKLKKRLPLAKSALDRLESPSPEPPADIWHPDAPISLPKIKTTEHATSNLPMIRSPPGSPSRLRSTSPDPFSSNTSSSIPISGGDPRRFEISLPLEGSSSVEEDDESSKETSIVGAWPGPLPFTPLNKAKGPGTNTNDVSRAGMIQIDELHSRVEELRNALVNYATTEQLACLTRRVEGLEACHVASDDKFIGIETRLEDLERNPDESTILLEDVASLEGRMSNYEDRLIDVEAATDGIVALEDRVVDVEDTIQKVDTSVDMGSVKAEIQGAEDSFRKDMEAQMEVLREQHKKEMEEILQRLKAVEARSVEMVTKRAREETSEETAPVAKKAKLSDDKRTASVGRRILRTGTTIGIGAIAAWGFLAFS